MERRFLLIAKTDEEGCRERPLGVPMLHYNCVSGVPSTPRQRTCECAALCLFVPFPPEKFKRQCRVQEHLATKPWRNTLIQERRLVIYSKGWK